MAELSPGDFPSITGTVQAYWAPVLLHPVLGSPERLVVAVVAADERGFHVEVANALRRLECLFGAAANSALFATEIAIEELKGALAARGVDALQEGSFVFSGVTIGSVSRGEAGSLADLASTWMGALSSLYKAGGLAEVESEPAAEAEADNGAAPDRLPFLVLEDVRAKRPGLERFFSEEIRTYRQRRSRSVTGVSVDYSGAQLVASFGTLQTATRASSVDRIKRKLFDLIVRRDEESSTLTQRQHDMIVFSPGRDSPLASERQLAALEEALDELATQSLREEVGFQSVHSVTAIGDHIVRSEELAVRH